MKDLMPLEDALKFPRKIGLGAVVQSIRSDGIPVIVKVDTEEMFWLKKSQIEKAQESVDRLCFGWLR